MKNTYRFGRSKERLVASRLSSAGHRTKLQKGSRGPFDILSTKKGTGKRWVTEVKSTTGSAGAISLPSKSVGRLLRSARARGATPVIARVKGSKVKFTSARTGQRMKP